MALVSTRRDGPKEAQPPPVAMSMQTRSRNSRLPLKHQIAGFPMLLALRPTAASREGLALVLLKFTTNPFGDRQHVCRCMVSSMS